MNNLKKFILLLSIVSIFAIGCSGSKEAFNSTFDVITDDPTIVPENPPFTLPEEDSNTDSSSGSTTTENVKRLPSSFDFLNKNDYIELDSRAGNFSSSTPVNIADLALTQVDIAGTQASFLEYTSGVSNPENILKSISIINNPRNHQDSNLQLKLEGQTVYNALGSAGQKAKVKFDVYFIGNSKAGNYIGAKDIRTLYITIVRK